MKQILLRVTVTICMLLHVLANPTFSAQQKRIALIIGNGAYKSNPLKNPVNDAGDIADALQELDFNVMLKINADHRTMKKAIRRFGKKLRSGGVGLFYFAGHGLQVKGRNFLIPIGADIEAEADIEFEAVDAARVLAQMDDAGNKLNIIILDACRDNPFARSFRSGSRGLAKMDAPTGSILAYATSPGSVAADGQGRNGLYTSVLLKHMMVPGLTIEKMFKQVRIDVVNDSGDKQVPWESSSLTGDFYFNTDRGITVVKHKKLAVEAEKLSPTISKPQQTTMEMELAFWQSIQNSDNAAPLEAYIEQFPNGTFAALAKVKIDALGRKKLEEERKRLTAENKRIAIEERKRLTAEKKRIALEEELKHLKAENKRIAIEERKRLEREKQSLRIAAIEPFSKLKAISTSGHNKIYEWIDYNKPLKLQYKIPEYEGLVIEVNIPENIVNNHGELPLKIKASIDGTASCSLRVNDSFSSYGIPEHGKVINIKSKYLKPGLNKLHFESGAGAHGEVFLWELSFDLSAG